MSNSATKHQSSPNDEGHSEHVKLANIINVHKQVANSNSENCVSVSSILVNNFGLPGDVITPVYKHENKRTYDTSFLFCPKCADSHDSGWLVMSSSPQLIKDCSITERNMIVEGSLIVAIPLHCQYGHKYILCIGDNQTSTRMWLREIENDIHILSEGSGPLESQDIPMS